MIIEKYGILLRRLTQEDLELVRVKRNEDSVRNYMFYKKIITPEEQQTWFETINNIHNYYFIIEADGKKVGMINGKNIDYDHRTSEGGIFFWDEEYRNGLIASLASIILADFTFLLFEFNKTYAEVLASNKGQIQYNEFMGYELVRVEGEKLIYVLTRENYLKKRGRIVKAVQQLTKDKSEITWQDLNLSGSCKEDVKTLYAGLPTYVQQGLNHIL